jgi:molybdopterin-guanine dinucleotide biosynthesis protein A
LDRSAIILAAGSQGKFSEDRGILKLDNKPLLNHVVDAVKGIVGEVLVVTISGEQAELYAGVVSSANVHFIIDIDGLKGTLSGALTGFMAAHGEYCLLLQIDAPFVSKEVAGLLFDCCVGKSAVIPRWPDHQIESLQAVYHTAQAMQAARDAQANGAFEVEDMVSTMRGIRYLSTMVVEQLDPDFRTFFKVNSPLDLKKAVMLTKPRKMKNRP